MESGYVLTVESIVLPDVLFKSKRQRGVKVISKVLLHPLEGELSKLE